MIDVSNYARQWIHWAWHKKGSCPRISLSSVIDSENTLQSSNFWPCALGLGQLCSATASLAKNLLSIHTHTQPPDNITSVSFQDVPLFRPKET